MKELWIRSQDRMTLIKAEELSLGFWRDDAKVDVNTKSQDYYETVGTYATKERALDVLDEIQNILKPKYLLDSSSIKPDGNNWVENGIIYQKYNANAKVEELSTYVYEMPKE